MADKGSIREATSEADIRETFPVMNQLRPHLGAEEYPGMVQRMMKDGYRLIALRDGEVVRAVAGFRIFELLHRGVALYVDDLVTDEASRSRGYGEQLLAWLDAEAKSRGCTQVHLDSGVQRRDAHRFYFREKMSISSFHFERPVT